MNTRTNNIRRVVMRRIYINYAARIVSHPLLLQGAAFTVAMFVFAEMVFVEKVLTTLRSLPLSGVPDFALNAVMRGEVVTLSAMAVMTLSIILALRHVSRHVLPALIFNEHQAA